MELIIFFKELKKKKGEWFNVWFSILMRWDGSDSQTIPIFTQEEIPRATYYRIIATGISVFNESISGYKLSKVNGGILIIKTETDTETQNKIETKIENQVTIIDLKQKEPEVENYPVVEILNQENKSITKTKVRSVKEKDYSLHIEILKYLGDCNGIKYNTDNISKSYVKVIEARINEGYSFSDFKLVIETKCRQWLNTEQAIYIRPETLFSNKFESYLNQSKLAPKTKQESNYDKIVAAAEIGYNNLKV